MAFLIHDAGTADTVVGMDVASRLQVTPKSQNWLNITRPISTLHQYRTSQSDHEATQTNSSQKANIPVQQDNIMDESSNQGWWQQCPLTDLNQPPSPGNEILEGFEEFCDNETRTFLIQEMDGLHINGHGTGPELSEQQGWALADQQQQLQQPQEHQQQQLGLSTMHVDADLGSMGAHFSSEMPLDLQMGPALASYPHISLDASQFAPADPWNPTMLGPDWIPSSSDMASFTWLTDMPNTDAEFGPFDVTAMTTPSSLAMEFNSSSSSANSGLQSAAVGQSLETCPRNVARDTEHRMMTPDSATTSSQDHSEPTPKAAATTGASFSCPFFPCARNFPRQCDLR